MALACGNGVPRPLELGGGMGSGMGAGHSLGAAMALFFAAELALRRPDLAKRLQSVHAFGSPRVGDPAFCRFLESTFPSSVVRFTHGAGRYSAYTNWTLLLCPLALGQRARPTSS